MPTSKQGKSYCSNTVIVLLVFAALLNAVAFFCVFYRIMDLTVRVNSLVPVVQLLREEMKKPAVATSQEKPVLIGDVSSSEVDYTNWDLKFKYPRYPSEFFVEQVEDSFVGGQMNIRITSQKGRLELSAGGPLATGPDVFYSGYEMDIHKLSQGQTTMMSGPLVTTGNPLVQKINFTCQDAGCPDGDYVINSRKGKYEIIVRASNDYFTKRLVGMISDQIIASIHE